MSFIQTKREIHFYQDLDQTLIQTTSVHIEVLVPVKRTLRCFPPWLTPDGPDQVPVTIYAQIHGK